jgi:hypothetical protein
MVRRMLQDRISYYNAGREQDANIFVRHNVRSFAPWPKRPVRNVVRYSQYAGNPRRYIQQYKDLLTSPSTL